MEDVFLRVGKAFKHVVKSADQVVQVGKAKFDATKLYRERMTLFEHLGERTFHLIQAGKFSQDDVKQIIDRIEKINEQIQAQAHSEDREDEARTQQASEKKRRPKTSSKKKSTKVSSKTVSKRNTSKKS
ncbi:MAG: hypothetical protein R3A11_06480 [Bdellovibrionota bacterium]